jgi:tetratricopeptide (TPR) repeat protein
MGLAQLTLGQREEAIATWKECIELAGKTTQPVEFGANSNYNLACAYSLLGRLDEAFAALEAAFGMGESEEVAGLREHALQDPDLANLRQDARWPRLYPEGVPAPDEEE